MFVALNHFHPSLIFWGKACSLPTNCCLYYKHITIINDNSSIVSKWGYKLIDYTRGIIYDHNIFIIQANGLYSNCKLLALPANIGLRWKLLTVTNTLAYNGRKKKSIITRGLLEILNKFFLQKKHKINIKSHFNSKKLAHKALIILRNQK